MKKLYFLALCLCISMGIRGQQMQWVFLNGGQTYGSCMSDTDCTTDQLCYGLQYTPSMTGTMTSYTTGFFTECVSGADPIVTNSSCTMTDNSSSITDCGGSGLILLNSSGNSGTISVTKDVPVMIHQLCLDLPHAAAINLTEDELTGLTVSIDSVDGGGPQTDVPTFTNTLAANADCDETCKGFSCDKSFDTASGDFTFTNAAGSAIVNGTSLMNSQLNEQSFDIYNEETEDCGTAGGVDDITFGFKLIHTADINGNGIIDLIGGSDHHIIQTVDGLRGSVPMGSTVDSESSTGDFRGYEITVDFENHLAIYADKLTVNLAGLNSAGSAFESAILIFNDYSDDPYGSATYNGFYSGVTDLSGGCGATSIGTVWTVTGPGVFGAQSTNTVDLTDPCNPIMNVDGMNSDSAVVASVAAGLNPTDTIGGFTLRVILEDVAAPGQLDDGSGNAPDDGIAGNANTTTNELGQSRIEGFKVLGCVFGEATPPLPIELLSFTAAQNEKVVDLDWRATLDEFDRFIVEWGTDGQSFKPIGTVNSAIANSTTPLDFQHIHTNPIRGKNYYRLKQIDLDGTYEYSGIRVVDYFTKERSDLNIFPNPTNDKLYLEFPTTYENDAFQLRLMDANGKIIRQGTRTGGNDNFYLNVDELPSGLYVLYVRTRKSIHSKRFIKQEK